MKPLHEVLEIKQQYEEELQTLINNKLLNFEEETGYSPSNVVIDRIEVTTVGDTTNNVRKFVTGLCEVKIPVQVRKQSWEEI